MKEYKTRVSCCIECPNLREITVTMHDSLIQSSYCLLMGADLYIANRYSLPGLCPLPDVDLSNIEPVTIQETTNGN